MAGLMAKPLRHWKALQGSPALIPYHVCDSHGLHAWASSVAAVAAPMAMVSATTFSERASDASVSFISLRPRTISSCDPMPAARPRPTVYGHQP